MINLLPQKDKNIIKREILRRYINILGLCFCFLFFVEIAFSLVALFFSVSFSKNLNDQLITTKNVANSKNLEVLEEEINKVNNRLLSIEVSENLAANITGNISKILDIQPDSIKIESFSFESKKILLRGHSETRNGLLGFIEDIERIDCADASCFPETTLPVSNLLEEKDFDFSLSISMN